MSVVVEEVWNANTHRKEWVVWREREEVVKRREEILRSPHEDVARNYINARLTLSH